MTTTSPTVADELDAALGTEVVLRSERDIMRVLKDNSWLSPVLVEQLNDRIQHEGPTLGVLAVVAPTSEEQVKSAVAIAARRGTPITPRGSGTSNFGLVTPARGGIILDLRGLKSTLVMEGDNVRASAGVMQGQLERTARENGRELTIMTTTFATATTGGWIAGGHVGLGSSVYGSVWDHNVIATRVVTVEEQPSVVELDAAASLPLLHTFGAVGIVTEITMPTVPAVSYVEAVGTFPNFEAACAFVHEMSTDTTYRHRVVTAQEGELASAFRLLDPIVGAAAGVLMIIDELQTDAVATLARQHGGEVVIWQPWTLGASERPSIAAMVYGHRMLWVKKLLPNSAFLHVYFDPDDPMSDVDALRGRFGSDVLIEMKYIRSAWLRGLMGHPGPGTLPASVITIRHGDRAGEIDKVMEFCGEAGIRYQNPHTSVIEDSGMFPDIGKIVDLKARLDPHALLNPGKLRAAQGPS